MTYRLRLMRKPTASNLTPEYSLSQASLSLDQFAHPKSLSTEALRQPKPTSPRQPPTSPGSSKIDIHPFLKLSRSGYGWMRRQTVRLSKKATCAARRKCDSHLALVL